MKSEKTFLELQSLKKEVQRLSREVESIKTAVLKDPYAVENLLRMRGFYIHVRPPHPEERTK